MNARNDILKEIDKLTEEMRVMRKRRAELINLVNPSATKKPIERSIVVLSDDIRPYVVRYLKEGWASKRALAESAGISEKTIWYITSGRSTYVTDLVADSLMTAMECDYNNLTLYTINSIELMPLDIS